MLDLAVPVHNEQRQLESSIRTLHAYLSAHFPYTFRITIVDNGSSDLTPAIADRLATDIAGVSHLRLADIGRGHALRAAWCCSDAAVLAYCDVDLSTHVSALLPLLAPLISGHSQLAIGTRLAAGSRVARRPGREILSRGYNAILRTIFGAQFSDAQCGFKAIRLEAARLLLPLVHDTAWFFDTELLLLAQSAGMRIYEVPVDWTDDIDSSVNVIDTVIADIQGLARLHRSGVLHNWDVHRIRSDLDDVAQSWRSTRTDAPTAKGVPMQRAAAPWLCVLLYGLLRTMPVSPTVANLLALAGAPLARAAATDSHRHMQRRPWSNPPPTLIENGTRVIVTSGALALWHAGVGHRDRTLELLVLYGAHLLARQAQSVLLRSTQGTTRGTAGARWRRRWVRDD